MKKGLGIISWMIEVISVIAVILTTWFIDAYLIFFIGWLFLIVGIIGILVFSPKTKELLFKVLDFI